MVRLILVFSLLWTPAFAEEGDYSSTFDAIDRFNDGFANEDCLDGERQERARVLDPELCDRRESTLNRWADEAKPLKDFSLPESDVYLVGETHLVHGCRHYPEFFETLRQKTKFDCFVIELTEEKLKNYDQAPVGSSLRCYREALDSLRSKGVKIHVIDKPPAPGETTEDLISVEGLNRRDVHMAGRINDLMKSGECRKIGGLFGKFHMTAEHPNRKTLSQILRSSRKVTTINYQNTEPHFPEVGWGLGLGEFEDDTWAYANHCPMPRAQFAKFATVRSSDAHPDMDFVRGEGAWRDYDVSVFSGPRPEKPK